MVNFSKRISCLWSKIVNRLNSIFFYSRLSYCHANWWSLTYCHVNEWNSAQSFANFGATVSIWYGDSYVINLLHVFSNSSEKLLAIARRKTKTKRANASKLISWQYSMVINKCDIITTSVISMILRCKNEIKLWKKKKIISGDCFLFHLKLFFWPI